MYTLHIIYTSDPPFNCACILDYALLGNLLPVREHSARKRDHRRQRLASKTAKEREGPRNMLFSPHDVQHKKDYTQERKASRSREGHMFYVTLNTPIKLNTIPNNFIRICRVT